MSDYFRNSSSAYYSLIASLPLLIGYEVLVTLTQSSYWKVRNAADVWIRTFLMAFDIKPQYITFVMIALVFLLIPLVKVRSRGTTLHGRYFVLMFFESLAYSLVLGLVLHTLLRVVLLSTGVLSNSQLQNLALSMGAGLFEEFFFRVLLLNGLYWLLRNMLRSTIAAGITSIFLASLLFSLSHYIGNMADEFQWYSFMFRWMAGLLFTVLYFFRGFAVTAYTHALYDIQVLI